MSFFWSRLRLLFLPLCLLLSAVLPQGASAESGPDVPPAVDARIEAEQRNADLGHWKRIFENPRREVFHKRFLIAQAARPESGMQIADIGAGTGFFSLLFARAVGPTGKVYAVDISDAFLEEIRRRALEEYHATNVETILNDQNGTGLPAASVDLVFLCNTYHHFENPARMLASISAALRAGGELILVDYRRIQGVSSDWVMSHVRANKEEVIEELLDAGFVLVDDEDFLRENYFLRFRKQPEAAP